MNPIRLCPGPARTPPRRLDQVLPLDKTGKRLPGINDVKLAVIEGGPHVIRWTRANHVNTALLASRAADSRRSSPLRQVPPKE